MALIGADELGKKRERQGVRENLTRETLEAMTSRRLLVQRIIAVSALTTSGCSIGMRPVRSGWDGSDDPNCTDDEALVYADAIGAGLLIGAGAAAANESGESGNEAVAGIAVAGLVGGLALAVSALIGEGKYKRCHEAYAQWRIGGAIGTASVYNRPAPFADVEHREVAAPKAKPAPEPIKPRGFFCSSSASGGFCVRDKAECSRTRDVSIGALPDLTECTLTEQAWCTGDLCFPDEGACDARRERAGTELACKQMQ